MITQEDRIEQVALLFEAIHQPVAAKAIRMAGLCGTVHHAAADFLAAHRIAAGKAVLDRLREPTHEMVSRLNAACDTPDVNMAWVFPFIATALADALETNR